MSWYRDSREPWIWGWTGQGTTWIDTHTRRAFSSVGIYFEMFEEVPVEAVPEKVQAIAMAFEMGARSDEIPDELWLDI